VTNTLAYYDGALIKMVKIFIVHACMTLLELNLMTVTNTLAYYDGVLIKVVKSFINLAPVACTISVFTAVIYGFP